MKTVRENSVGDFHYGDYVDSDSNGMVDACEEFELMVMNNGTDVTEVHSRRPVIMTKGTTQPPTSDWMGKYR